MLFALLRLLLSLPLLGGRGRDPRERLQEKVGLVGLLAEKRLVRL
jgi:hypothetical protein